jgi:hypothetical protein
LIFYHWFTFFHFLSYKILRRALLAPRLHRVLFASARMASSTTTPYGAAGAMADYKAAFPAIPRAGTAAVTQSQAAGPAPTTVHFAAKPEGAAAAATLEARDAERETVAVTYAADGASRTLTVSLGPAAKVDAAALRKAALAAVAKLRALKADAASLVLPAVAGIPAEAVASIVVQAATLSNYSFDRYVTLEDKKAGLVGALHFQCSSAEQEAAA